jgi:parallel beta-helix repeat protein
VHGASGVNVEGNVAYNNYGHCYYLEDGVEENNKFTRNVGLLSHPKTWGDHHGTDASEGYSTFWITSNYSSSFHPIL